MFKIRKNVFGDPGRHGDPKSHVTVPLSHVTVPLNHVTIKFNNR